MTDSARASGRWQRSRPWHGWLLVGLSGLTSWSAPACEVTSISLAQADGASARLRIEHDGGAVDVDPLVLLPRSRHPDLGGEMDDGVLTVDRSGNRVGVGDRT